MNNWDLAGEIICDLLSKTKVNIKEKENMEVWKMVFELGKYHRIEGVLLKALAERNRLTSVPRDLLEEEYQRVSQSVDNNKRINEYAKKIFTALNAKAIPFLALKGIALTESIYRGNYSDRVYSDIDILIKTDDISRVTSVLNGEGLYQYDEDLHVTGTYVLASRKSILERQLLTHELYPFTNGESNESIDVDVNTCFSWKGPREYREPKVDFCELWERRRFLSRTNGWTLSPNHMLIHLCTHLYNEAVFFLYDNADAYREVSYYRFYDIYKLLKQRKRYVVSMETILEDVKHCGAEKQVYYSLFYVEKLFGKGKWTTLLKLMENSNLVNDIKINQFYVPHYGYFEWDASVIERMNDVDKRKNAVQAINMKIKELKREDRL